MLSFSKMERFIYRQKYNLSPDFKFNGFNVLFYGDGKIEGGAHSYRQLFTNPSSPERLKLDS